MKYAAALMTFALAAPALAQPNVQSDPEEFRKMICNLRGVCEPAEQDKAWEAARAMRELGAAGPVKGPLPTVGVAASSRANSAANSTRNTGSKKASTARGDAARVIPNRRPRPVRPVRPVAPVIAVVPEAIKNDFPMVVTFASNSSDLSRESYSAVSTFADLIRVDRAMGKLDSKYLIEGHTDSAGPAGFNQDLSRARAQSVADALVKMGFSADRFVVAGKGESEPLKGTRGRDAVNRRVIAKAID